MEMKKALKGIIKCAGHICANSVSINALKNRSRWIRREGVEGWTFLTAPFFEHIRNKHLGVSSFFDDAVSPVSQSKKAEVSSVKEKNIKAEEVETTSDY